MQHDGNDIPRLPAEDMVDRSTDIADVAHDDERHRPHTDDANDDIDGDEAESGDDLDPQMTD